MPFSALYCLATAAIVTATFLVLYKKRGWKMALGVSFLALVIMTGLFWAILTFALSNMG